MELPDSSVVILGFARACGFAAFLPVPEQAIGAPGRIGGAVLLTAAIASGWEAAAAPFSILELFGQFLTGVAAALPIALLLSAAAMWGELFDGARGQSLGSMYDPLSGVQQAVLPVALSQGIFLLLLGEGVLSDAVAIVLTAPPVSVEPVQLGAAVLKLTLATLTQTAVLVIPIAVVFLLIDAAFGAVGRSVQALSLSSEAFLAKSVAGWVVLLAIARSGWIPRPLAFFSL